MSLYSKIDLKINILVIRIVLYRFDTLLRAGLPACVLPLLIALAACGGGGGGSGDPGRPSENDSGSTIGGTSTTSSTTTARAPKSNTLKQPDIPAGWETRPEVWADEKAFRKQDGLSTINAEAAYAKAITGKGQVIGFVDTGLDAAHPEFAAKDIKLNDRSGLEDESDRQLRHGTGVASVALGDRRGAGDTMFGVAFDAVPAMWSINLDSAGYLDLDDAILTRGVRALQNSGARIVNQSWGYSTLLDPALADTQRQFLQGNFGNLLDEMHRGQAIHVWAAGNSGGKEISVSTAWPVLFPELAGYSVIVAALGNDGQIGRRSNQCGVAKAHCLVAPGGAAIGGRAYTQMARAGGGYRTAYGTSYAAPYVSGVLALMRQAFGDQLSLPEYTARLLATANKTGVYADEAIYGQGLVDVAAALSPQGDVYIPLPSGGLIAPADGFIDSGVLPEDMLERLRREKIIVLDALNTPFTTNLLGRKRSHQSFELTNWMSHGDDKVAPNSHPMLASFAAVYGGKALGEYWKLVPVVFRETSANDSGIPKNGLGIMARRTRRRSRLEIGLVGEKDSLWSSVGGGALTLGATKTAVMSFGHDLEWGALKLGYDAHFSFSHSEGDDKSLVTGTTGALTSAFTVTARRGGVLIKLKQPSYFETGDLRINLPRQRQAGGEVVFAEKSFSMQAGHRPFEIELLYGDATRQLGVKLSKEAGDPVQLHLGFLSRF